MKTYYFNIPSSFSLSIIKFRSKHEIIIRKVDRNGEIIINTCLFGKKFSGIKRPKNIMINGLDTKIIMVFLPIYSIPFLNSSDFGFSSLGRRVVNKNIDPNKTAIVI